MTIFQRSYFYTTLVFLLLLGTTVVTAQEQQQQCADEDNGGECLAAAAAEECKDLDDKCLQWASVGKCSDEELDLRTTCPKSCRTCWSCDNVDDSCAAWADSGECQTNPRYMLVYCAKACNVCHYKGDLEELMVERLEEKQKEAEQEVKLDKTRYGVEQTLSDDKSKEVYLEMVNYMDNIVMAVENDDKYKRVRDDCKLRSENCIFWAGIGECDSTSKDYMVVQCAPACQTCELLDFETRCPYAPNDPTALNDGDMNSMFENMILMEEYSPTILSRPSNSTSEENDNDVIDGPWVVTLDDFLTPEECNRLIELGGTVGYLESADVGKKNWDGTFNRKVNTGRTSTNAWCQNDCEQDPVTQAVTERMQKITGIPSVNFEYLQLLRYEIGQFYQVHHDYIAYHQQRKQGVRTLTIFLYLNTVEEGGGTNFPLLNNLTVVPKQGKALIWPSTLDADPNSKDPRTDHQALPVEKGQKFGANVWVHQRDFKEPFSRACI